MNALDTTPDTLTYFFLPLESGRRVSSCRVGLAFGKHAQKDLLQFCLGCDLNSSQDTAPGGDIKGKPKAFIVMPFNEKGEQRRPAGFFKEVLRSLLTPAGLAAGFVVETANRQGSDVIQSTIVNDLLDADLVIADLTDHNPNVLFELGVRIAEDKPVVLVKASGTGQIFDVDNMMRVYEYSANLWQSTIEKDLTEITDHIKAGWEKRAGDQSYMKILRRGARAAN